MNKMKCLLLLALCAMATGSMTSCLNSDDDGFDSRFTEEELSTYLTRLSGIYVGKLMFYHNGQNKAGTRDSMMLDSIENVRWRIARDSTIVIDNFPDSIYNNAITGNSDFRKILVNAPEKMLKCKYTPYKGLTQNNTVAYGFWVLPDGTVKNNANGNAMYTTTQITEEDDKQYDVEYGYVTNAPSYIEGFYSYYQATGYLSATNNINFLLIMADIKCPGTQSFTTETYLVLLKGRKL